MLRLGTFAHEFIGLRRKFKSLDLRCGEKVATALVTLPRRKATPKACWVNERDIINNKLMMYFWASACSVMRVNELRGYLPVRWAEIANDCEHQPHL